MKPKLRHKGSHHKKTWEKSKPLTNCVAWIFENQNATPREGKLGEQPLKCVSQVKMYFGKSEHLRYQI